jgi:hypothetical protein
VRGGDRRLSSEFRLSADGLYYWDGRTWHSALSADGRLRWDGTRWVAVAQPAPPAPVFRPPPAAVSQPKAQRVPTSWTRPLQLSVAAVFGLWGIYSLSIPIWLAGPMEAYMRQVAQRQAEQAPQLYPDPTQYANTMSSIASVALWMGAVIGVAIAAVVIAGALRRWTWIYYVVLVLLGLQVLGLPYQVASAAGLVTLSTMAMPAAVSWIGIVAGLLAAGLGGWMLVALLTRGPWATRRPAAT